MTKPTIIFVELRRMTSDRKKDNEMVFLGARYDSLKNEKFLPDTVDAFEYEDLRHLIVGGWVNALYPHLKEYDATVLFITRPGDVEKIHSLNVDNPLFFISIMSGNFNQANFVVKSVREEHPDAKIVVGGVHPTHCPEETFSILQPDYLIQGEADEIIAGLVASIYKGDPFAFEGVWTKDERTHVRHVITANPDNFECNWELHDKYSNEINRNIVNYVSTRSCLYNCSFCGIVKTKYREMPPEKVICQITDLMNCKDELWVRWETPLCFKDIQVTSQVLNFLAGTNINFAGQHRVEEPTAERKKLYGLAARAGLKHLFLGIETVQNHLLEKMNKKNTNQYVEACLGALTQSGLVVNSGWIVGIPGQTEDDIKRDMEAAVNYIQKGIMQVALPQYLEIYPGSWFWNNAEKVGIKLDRDPNSYDLITQQIAHSTNELSKDQIWQHYCDFQTAVQSVL